MSKKLTPQLINRVHHLLVIFCALFSNYTSAQVKDEFYNVPVYFHPLKNNISYKKLELEYDLSKKDELRIGPIKYTADSVVLAWFSEGDNSHPANSISGIENSNVLFMTWPEDLVPHGTIDFLDDVGDVLISKEITRKEMLEWQKKLKDIRSLSKNVQSKKNEFIFTTSVGLFDLNEDFLNTLSGVFRVCIRQNDDDFQSMICSQRLIIDKSKKPLGISKVVESVEPKILVNKKEVSLKDTIDVKKNEKVDFFSLLSTGASYEFSSSVEAPKIYDMYQLISGEISVSGVDPLPIGARERSNANEEDTFWNRIGFQQTIGDLRNHWLIYMPAQERALYFKGKGGGVFKQNFEFSEIPSESLKVFVSRQAPKSNGDDDIIVKVKAPKYLKLSSAEKEVKKTVDNPEVYSWKMSTPKMLDYNSSSLIISSDKKKAIGSLMTYKGFSNEVSGRFSLVSSSDGVPLTIVDFLINYWPQDLFGWDSYYFSQQRWGLSMKSFGATNEMALGSGSNAVKSKLNVQTFDMKYRFNPGLWGRDETWGALLGYQSVTLAEVAAPMLGVGFFWARSLPRVFDDIFNIVPLMRYPKFVDMEFITYNSPMSPTIKLRNTYSINFHGKVFWTDRFFGEAGFGMKRFDYSESAAKFSLGANFFYVTAGLGINF